MKYLVPIDDWVGMKVYNIHRRDFHTSEPTQVGIIGKFDKDDVCLIPVDCNLSDGYVNQIPVQDLAVFGVSPTQRLVDVNG